MSFMDLLLNKLLNMITFHLLFRPVCQKHLTSAAEAVVVSWAMLNFLKSGATKMNMLHVSNYLNYCMCIRTVSSKRLLSALLNWLKLVYGLFGKSIMHFTLSRPARKESNVPKLKSSYGLTVKICLYTMTLMKPSSHEIMENKNCMY